MQYKKSAAKAYSLTQVADISEIENFASIKNPQDVAHLDEVRRLAGDHILVFDPAQPRFLDNILKSRPVASGLVSIAMTACAHRCVPRRRPKRGRSVPTWRNPAGVRLNMQRKF